MFELGFTFEHLQKNQKGLIFDLNDQIVLYDIEDNHISTRILIIFKRINCMDNFDRAEKIIDVENLKNSNISYLFYKNITDKNQKNLILEKNKNICKFEDIVGNWNKIYEKESFKESLFKAVQAHINFHNFKKYIENYSFEIKSHIQYKWDGDSPYRIFLKGDFIDTVNNQNKFKNAHKYNDVYISSFLKYSKCVYDDGYTLKDDISYLLNEEGKYDERKILLEKNKIIRNSIINYKPEDHIKTILQNKGLYDLALDEFPNIKSDLSEYAKSFIDHFVKKLEIINNKESLLLQIT